MTAVFIIILALFFINYLSENFFNKLREEKSAKNQSFLPSPSINKTTKRLKVKKDKPPFFSVVKNESFPLKKGSFTPPEINLTSINKEHQLKIAPSRAKQLVEKLSFLNQLIVYQEILSPPKSLKKNDE